MKAVLLGILLALWGIFYAGCSSNAGDFEIERIIDIGPVAAIPMANPIQWSPDGTKILYFNRNGFVIADTLGNIELLHDFGLYLQRYLWLSNNEICLDLHEGVNQDSSLNRLILFNIDTKEISILDQYIRYQYWHDRTNTTSYEGPYVTINGSIYYRHFLYAENSSRVGVNAVNRWVAADNATSMKNDYILRWHPDGLYQVNLEFSDSLHLFPSLKNMTGGAIMSPNHQYALSGGIYVNLIDSTYLNINSIIQNPLDSSYSYGVIFSNFNPKYHEILVDVAFDDDVGERTVATMIGVFNPESREFTMIDPPGDQKFCGYPSYSPDGLKIAFIADHEGFIIFRKPGSVR